MAKKISTIEELGSLVQDISFNLAVHIDEERENNKSIGDHLASIENCLEELVEIDEIRKQLERMRQNIREKLHVEV